MTANPRPLATFVALILISPAALATVNHGNFIGTGVDFLDVSETTTTADPEPIWGAPTLSVSGNQLLFTPPAFISSCASGSSDVTSSDLTTTISAQGGVHIEVISLQEAGDATLTSFPPFGTAATNANAAVSGLVRVIEDTGGPIAPVVIPFGGTFTPKAGFALPTDFGTFNWTGNVSVDVASVVPNATVVELELTNTLDTNCAAGATGGVIQKKSVSGPTVALMVNPLECSLELDKTCCVTQPSLADLDVCGDDDDIVRLVMKYTGDKCHKSNNDQGKHFRCYGKRTVGGDAGLSILKNSSEISASQSSNIQIGDEIEFTSSTGTLFDQLKLKVLGPDWRRQILKIDTSCDRAINCGDRFGAFTVTGVETVQNGTISCGTPTPPECAPTGDPVGTPCDAKLVDMVLEYNGQPCQIPLPNPQNGEAKCEGDATGATDVGVIYTGKFPSRQTVSPSSGINDGDLVRVTATFQGGLFPNQEFKIVDSGGVRQRIDFHVSCSQPLALGDEFGSFKLVEFTTKNGTLAALGSGDPGPFDACEVPLAPPGPHCTSPLEELTLVYIGDFLGEGCTVSNPQGGYAACIGDADPGDPVSLTVPANLEVDPVDTIEFGDLVSIRKVDGSTLSSVSFSVGDGTSMQTLVMHAGCHKPLSLGDRFGSFVVFGMDPEDEGPISLGGNVQYQFKVTNPSLTDTVDNVSIEDSELGTIVSGLSLAPGEMQTFAQNATLFGTTTNVATANGDVGGDVCDPGTDQVTIDVLAPPPGSFNCSEPLSALTVIWDGAQTVDVKVWSGVVGSVLLNEFDDVAPGDAIEVDGLRSTYPTYEIFDQTGTTKLGQSRFDTFCNDWSMNGIEDCGKRNGDLASNDPGLINDWLLEGMVDTDETLACTPGLVPNPPACGFGPELIVLMPGLMWLHRRRLRKQA